MIEHYTIKFGPAVSLKELEKALHESGDIPAHTGLNKFKARIEFVGEFEDVRKVKELIKSLKQIVG